MRVCSSLWVLEAYLTLGPTVRVTLRPRPRPSRGLNENCCCFTRKKSTLGSSRSAESLPNPKNRDDSIPDAVARHPQERRLFSTRKEERSSARNVLSPNDHPARAMWRLP